MLECRDMTKRKINFLLRSALFQLLLQLFSDSSSHSSFPRICISSGADSTMIVGRSLLTSPCLSAYFFLFFFVFFFGRLHIQKSFHNIWEALSLRVSGSISRDSGGAVLVRIQRLIRTEPGVEKVRGLLSAPHHNFPCRLRTANMRLQHYNGMVRLHYLANIPTCHSH